MKFPEWWKAPEEILKMDGHCGLVAAWPVLHYFGKHISVPEIIASCRYTKRYGVFLAAGLKEHGLQFLSIRITTTISADSRNAVMPAHTVSGSL
jgi:hypothetical protein